MNYGNCVQCGRPAVASANGRNLCVDHAIAWQTVVNQQQAQSAAMINMLKDQIEDVMGVPRTSARINVPAPIVQQGGQYTFNNIRVDRSVIGSINTAQVEQIDVSMSNVKSQSGDGEIVAEQLKALTEHLLENKDVDDSQREQALEYLAYIANQISAHPKQRQPAVSRQVLKLLSSVLSTSADLVTVWSTAAPIITSFLS